MDRGATWRSRKAYRYASWTYTTFHGPKPSRSGAGAARASGRERGGLRRAFPKGPRRGWFSQRTRDELGATRRVLAEETPAHTPSSAQLAPSTPPVRAEFGPSPRGTRGLPPELAASSNGVCRELALSSRRARGELIHVQISTQPWIRLVNHSKIDHRAPLPRDTGMPR